MNMMRSMLLGSVAALTSMVFASGCGTPFIEATSNQGYSSSTLEEESDDPYVQAWQAMRFVLEDEFGENRVRVSSYPEPQWRKMYVHSAVHAQGLTKQRTEIQAYVTADEYNEPVPQIYVWHQMENPRIARHATNGLILGRGGAQKRWQRTGRNEVMEARLTNRVYEVLDGTPGFDSIAGTDPHVENRPPAAH